ncbi:MAG: CoA-binding protein [Bacteroidetes bacterium]|nr:CoA-binding protein [Bacteroidota bacterium]
MKTTKASIKTFLEARKLAIAGVSRDQKKLGYAVVKKLKETGFDLYLIHPEAETLHGERAYRTITDLPDDIGGLLIMTPKSETMKLVEDAVKKGIPNIWIQQMSETPEAVNFALSSNVNLVAGKCILMFAEPVQGFHKFHRTLKKLFGGMPK